MDCGFFDPEPLLPPRSKIENENEFEDDDKKSKKPGAFAYKPEHADCAAGTQGHSLKTQDSTGIFSTFDLNGRSQPSGTRNELGACPSG